jgi:DNA-binding GntR family transcriptional regulator
VGGILAALEPLALRLVPRFPDERLASLAELAKRLEQTRGDVARIVELDDAWHNDLLADCPNRRLLDLIATLRQVPRRYLHAYFREAGRLSLSTLHHTRILAALRRDDREAAAELLERRWRRGIEEMEAWIR